MSIENGIRRFYNDVTPAMLFSNCRSSVFHCHTKTGLPAATDATGPHAVHRSRRSLSFHRMAEGECLLTTDDDDDDDERTDRQA